MSWQEMKKDNELVGSVDEAQERTLIQRGRANISHEDNMLSLFLVWWSPATRPSPSLVKPQVLVFGTFLCIVPTSWLLPL